MSSDAKKLVSGSMVRVLSLFFNIIVGFFLTPFVIHSLGDRLYGFWILVGSFIGYYGLLDFGLSNAVSRHISRAIGAGDKEEVNDVFNTGLALFVGAGLIALLVTVIIAAFSGFFVDDSAEVKLFQTVILILGIHAAIDLPIRVFHGVLHAQLRFVLASKIQIFSSVLRTILIIVALSSGCKIVGLALVTLATNIISSSIYIIATFKLLPSLKVEKNSIKRVVVKKLGYYSFYVFVNKIGDQLRFYSDTIVISSFLGLAAAAHYNVATFMINNFNVLIGQVMGVLSPYFSQKEGASECEGMISSLFLSMKISICLATFIAFGFLFWGKPFILVWMGADYIDAYPCLVVLTLGMMVCLWNSPSYALVLGTSKHKMTSMFSVSEGVVNLLLSIVLVKKFGIVGVAIGTAIPIFIISAFVMPVYVCNTFGINKTVYFLNIYKSVLMAIISFCVPAIVTLQYVSASYIDLFAVGVFSFFWYSMCIWFLLFKKEERTLFLTVLSSRGSVGAISR